MNRPRASRRSPAGFALAARLFGRLLVRELDAATLAELAAPEVAGALAALGVPLPGAADLDELAADYHALWLEPRRTSPPVHSLFRDGHYNGEPARAVRAIAAAAGLELAAGARGAEPDQLGCILLLWAELIGPHPELAARLADDHLAWAERALQTAAADRGFYGAVARAAIALIDQLRAAAATATDSPSLSDPSAP